MEVKLPCTGSSPRNGGGGGGRNSEQGVTVRQYCNYNNLPSMLHMFDHTCSTFSICGSLHVKFNEV